MPRLLFEKRGNSIWISHLDLMRVFQRAFKRAELPLKHTQGFNPRPSVSIALPLSVGVESACELLDFDLDGVCVAPEQIMERLNDNLISGVRVIDVYENGRKIRELSLLQCNLMLEYDDGVPHGTQQSICALFDSSTLIVPKKTKSGIQDQNIIPMIRRISVNQSGQKELSIDALICCQNPTLNPVQIVQAINMYLQDLKPSFSRCSRIEVYDNGETIFR